MITIILRGLGGTAKQALLITPGSMRLSVDIFYTDDKRRLLTQVADSFEKDHPPTIDYFFSASPIEQLFTRILQENKSFECYRLEHNLTTQQVCISLLKKLFEKDKNYLSTLQKKYKWRVTKKRRQLNAMVWPLRSLEPRGNWPLWRIVKVFLWRDNVILLCQVRLPTVFFITR